MNATAPTSPQGTDPAALAATIDALLQQRMQQMTSQPAPSMAAPPMALPPGFTPGFQPMQQPGPMVPGFNGYGMQPMQPAANAAPPTPTELHCRISIPLPDGREVGGYLAFPVPASHASPAGLQALAAAIASTWPIAAYPPRNGYGGQQGGYGGGGGNGGFQGGGGGYGPQNGYQGNGGGFRRFSGGGGYGRRW